METIFFNSGNFRPEFKKLAVFIFLFYSAIGQAQTLGDYQSATSGNWSSAATWQIWTGTNWAAATDAPPTIDGLMTVTIQNTHTVTISTTSSTIAKTVIQTGGQLIIASGATVRFVAAVTDNKLTINGTLLNNGTIVFSGTSVVNAGGVFDNSSTGTLTFSGSSLQLGVSGTLKNASTNVTSSTADCLSFNSGSFYVHNFTTVGGFIPTATWSVGSTCQILGYTSITTGLPLNTNQSFYNFEWNTPSFVSSSPALLLLSAINGDLSINSTGSGTLSILSLSGVGRNFVTTTTSRVKIDHLNFQVGGNITFATASIVSSDGVSLTLNSTTSNQTVDTKGLTFDNLTINNPSHVISLSSALNIGESLSIVSTGTTLNSNGRLKLLSTSDVGFGNDASISAIPSGSSITGNVEVDRYMSNKGNIYRYVSAPVSNFAVSNFQADVPVYGNFSGASSCSGCTPSLYYYVASSAAYQLFPKSPQTNKVTFDKGRGYSAYINQSVLSGPATIHWFGTVNQGAINLPVSFSSAISNSSWNLVGNPYPSTIDWNSGAWVKTNIAQAIVVRDNSNGTYQYFPDDVGNETFNIGQIAKGQAFWVRTIGSNPSLQINEGAKISNVATFYRTATSTAPADRIVLSLSNGSSTDRAYFKIENDASPAMDYYDAPKMMNTGVGTLNLSTLLPGTSLPLAINAVDKITCADTIKLKLTGANAQSLASGSYSFSLNATGIMSNYGWVLRDKYLNTTMDLSKTTTYNFSVTTEALSRGDNRFELITTKKSVDLTLPVSGTTQLCSNASGVLKISNAQDQSSYSLEINGTSTASMIGNGGDLTFNLLASTLTMGKNVVRILVNTGCGHEYLANSLEVVRTDYFVPQIQSKSHCQEGTVSLKATNVSDGNTVHWYASMESTDVLGTGAVFLTPVLTKSKIFYAAGVNAAGCEGERTAITATIIAFDPALITAASEYVLQSNYATGNQWYFNDQLVDGASNTTLEVKENGIYSVQVSISGGCTTTAFYNVTNVIASPEQKLEKSVVVYPNPVSQTPLHIEVPETASSVTLLNNMGAVLDTIVFTESSDGMKKVDVGLDAYPSGIYFVRVKNSGESTTIKIAKK